MKRREFITLLGGAAVAWPLAAHAQQQGRVGVRIATASVRRRSQTWFAKPWLFSIARPQERWTAERITRMFGNGEQNLQLQPTEIWVHLTYQTAFVDNAGKLQTRRDIYNLDSRTLAAIKGARGVIEPTPERKRDQELVASGSGPRKPAPTVRNGAVSQSMVYPAPGYARPLFPPAFFR